MSVADYYFTSLFCSLLGPAVSVDMTLEGRTDTIAHKYSSVEQRVVIYHVLVQLGISSLVCSCCVLSCILRFDVCHSINCCLLSD